MVLITHMVSRHKMCRAIDQSNQYDQSNQSNQCQAQSAGTQGPPYPPYMLSCGAASASCAVPVSGTHIITYTDRYLLT